MSKFKVGDRVEVVSEDDDLGGRPRPTVGCRGVIKLASEWGCEVLLDGEPMGDDYPQSMTWAYDNKDIQLIGREVNNDRRDETTLTRRDHFAMAALTGFVVQGLL